MSVTTTEDIFEESVMLRAWAHYCAVAQITTCVFTQPNEIHLQRFKMLPPNVKMEAIMYVLDNNWFPPFAVNKALEWDGVDMDGTLAMYSHELAPWEYGEPIENIVRIVKERITAGRTVKVFTARACSTNNPFYKDCIRGAEDWTLKHIGMKLEVTSEKDCNMKELIDDRAIRVKFNKGVMCTGCLTS